MDIVIAGAGEVGRHSAEVLAPAGHNITLIDRSAKKLAECESLIDIRTLEGDCTRADVLRRAGVNNAELYIAATNLDEVNLLSASVAAAVGCDETIARVHHAAYFEGQGLDYGQHLGIDHLVCPEYSVARAIATTLRSPGAAEVEAFARGAIQMHRLPVNDHARAVGTPLKDLPLPRCTLIVAVERGGEAFRPHANSELAPGDTVTVLGDDESIGKVMRLLGVEAPRRYRVMLMGGSTQAVWLCRELHNRSFNVRLFESDPKRAEELAEKLPWVTVLTGDLISSDVLMDERIDQADAFIALSDDDENNILASARAKTLGVRQAIAVLQRPTYLHLLSHIGIDKAFSARASAVHEIMRRLESGPIRPLATLAAGVAEVYEARVTGAAGKVLGTPLRTLELPDHALVAVIQRAGKGFIPSADDELEPGDVAVLIAPAKARKELRRLFGG